MIPLRDNIPSRTTPVVNYTMIGLCALCFFGQLTEPNSKRGSFVEQYGMIPQRVLHPERPVLVPDIVRIGYRRVVRARPAVPSPVNPWLTLLTCIFLHGGWMHFLGNMWFLYIFGDNVEDRMGHVGYLLFYLGCGVAASMAHLLANPSSQVPTIGASGAIAGVMGSYMLLYPKAMVVSLVPLFYILQVVVLPAPVFLGIWFLLQFFQGTLAITTTQTGGVAWWAHIGGFAIGFGVAVLLRSLGQTRPPVTVTRPDADRIGIRRYQVRPPSSRPWDRW